MKYYCNSIKKINQLGTQVHGRLLLKTNQGISIIEILVFLSISTIGAVAVLSLMYSATNYQKTFRDNSSRNTDSRLFQLALQNFSLYGTQVYFAGNISLNGTGNNSGIGFFRQYSYQKLSDSSGNPEVLGYLLSENSISKMPPSAMAHEVTSIALVFQPPKINSPGVLMIFNKNSPDLKATDAVFSVVGVVEVQLYNPIEINNVLSSIELQYTIRKSLLKENTNANNKLNWCPEYDIKNNTSCSNQSAYRDVTESIVLQFRNNKRVTQFNGTEYSKGFYFFKPSWN